MGAAGGGGMASGAVVKRNTTYALVSFFRQASVTMKIDAYDAGALALGEPLNSALISFNYDKSLGGTCAGTVSLVLTGWVTAGSYQGMAWAELLNQGDWWSIDIVKNGVAVGLGFGVIDLVNVHEAASANGATEVQVTITGRDYGFALDDTPIYWNPFDPNVDNALGMNMLAILDKVAGKPHEVVVSMIRGLMGGLSAPGVLGGHTSVPSGLAGSAGSSFWIDHLNYTDAVQQDLRGFVYAVAAITPQGSPSVWSFVDSWRNPAMNEVFIDTKPLPYSETDGKSAVLVFREKPFVNSVDGFDSPWFKLTTWCVDAASIRAKNLSKGGNRVNHVAVTGDVVPAMGNDSYGLYVPVGYKESIQTYGLKRLEENVRYFDDSGESGFATDSKDWLYLVVSWNCLNHVMWSGSIDLAEMRPEIRIGQKIALTGGSAYPLQAGAWGFATRVGEPVDPSAMTFYVERVTHAYVAGEAPSATTTLTVSYGYLEGDRVADVTFETSQYKACTISLCSPLPPPAQGSMNNGEINAAPLGETKTIEPTNEFDRYDGDGSGGQGVV